MSKQIERLLAKAAEEEEEKKDPETPETPEDKPKDGEPAADGDEPAEETPSEEAPAENPGEEAKPKKDGDEDDDEAKALAGVVAENVELKNRVSLLEKAFAAEKAETARLRAALADPSFAAAAMRPQKVGAAVEAPATGPMTKEEAEEKYSRLKSAKERAAFRAAHADILGLKAR